MSTTTSRYAHIPPRKTLGWRGVGAPSPVKATRLAPQSLRGSTGPQVGTHPGAMTQGGRRGDAGADPRVPLRVARLAGLPQVRGSPLKRDSVGDNRPQIRL